ncbi:MAG TPA: hypothetical protein VGQ63_13980 [Pseudolabrys sp.]|jgi:hypothetical protein|nr:hypothetical protein [Pseudolabrys sp.]
MKPAEYRRALKKLRISVRGARHALGIDERTSRRYASPDYDGPIPKRVVLMIDALLEIRRLRQQQLP